MRSDPNRSDWLSNVWAYIHSVEKRVLHIEERLAELEAEARTNSESSKVKIEFLPLDEA